MTTEQDGAPSATAGGAPAPGSFPTVPEPFRRMFWIAAEDIANVIGCTVVEGKPRGYGEPAGPDPRDAEIERLRAQVDELAGIRVALFGEVRQALGDRDRWKDRYNQLIGDALAVQQHLQRAHGQPETAVTSEYMGPDFSRSMVDGMRIGKERAESEWDRLRAELAKRDLFRDVVASIKGAIGQVERIAAALPAEPNRQGCPCKSQCDYLDGEDRCSDSCDCAAGRRWVAGDPEPEAGTTVRRVDGNVTSTKRKAGSWHVNTCPRAADECQFGTVTWAWLSTVPLVEVVSADG